jgi:acid phosphatase (class A)
MVRTCRAGTPTTVAPSAPSLVTPDRAPVRASWPILIGARRMVSLPMNARAPISVRCFATPSKFAVMAPAPKDGDARDEADRRIFRETRVHYGTPRWEMAIADAQLGTGAMLEHFACSLDLELKPEDAPKLVAIAQKATREAASSMSKAKDFYKRKRPFMVDEGPTCVEHSTIGESFDYPSGHTTAGWAWGMVLSQVDPSRAGPLLARGRAIGDSRVVCGMHNASAVENARMLTGAAVSLASASALYQADLAYARAELATLRAGEHRKPDPARCAVEAELIKPYW